MVSAALSGTSALPTATRHLLACTFRDTSGCASWFVLLESLLRLHSAWEPACTPPPSAPDPAVLGLGRTSLTFADRDVLLVSVLWSFANLGVLSCGLPFLHIAASDVQLQALFSKPLLLLLLGHWPDTSLFRAAASHLASLPSSAGWQPRQPRGTDLCGGQLGA